MQPRLAQRSRRHLLWAFLLSLLLHACLLLPCFLVRIAESDGAGDGMGIDTRVHEPRMEVTLSFFDERPLRLKPPLARPQPVNRLSVPAPPAVTLEPGKEAVARVESAPEAVSGSSEEQEVPGITRPPGPGQSGDGGRLGKGAATFFQITTAAKSVVYVIDRSASMGLQNSFARAKQELLASIELLAADTRFQILAYNRSALPLPIAGHSGLAWATPENKRRAAELVRNLQAEGGTDHLAALKRALALNADVIFFLTDADELNPAQIATVTQLNHGCTVIHAIELTSRSHGDADPPLQFLARANHGAYRRVPVAP
jgi:von Willebrand factor type A domain